MLNRELFLANEIILVRAALLLMPSQSYRKKNFGGWNDFSKEDDYSQEVSFEEFDDFYSDECGLQIGDRVKSPAFGAGIVKDIDGLAVEIEFGNGKIRKLNAEFARLEKL